MKFVKGAVAHDQLESKGVFPQKLLQEVQVWNDLRRENLCTCSEKMRSRLTMTVAGHTRLVCRWRLVLAVRKPGRDSREVFFSDAVVSDGA